LLVQNIGEGVVIGSESRKAGSARYRANVARHNTTDANGGSGIDAAQFGSGNLIVANTALGNGGPDLNDENGDCGHNTWNDNSFSSNSPACIQ
jgi:hypothetical protein